MSLDAEPLRHTGHLLRRAQQLHVAVWQRDVSAETTSVQFAALSALEQRPRASQRDLGRVLDLDRSTIADLVARMVRRGLIERERDAGDRRRNALVLTGVGQEELSRLRPRVEAIEPTLTAPLDPAERAQLRALLHRVLEHAATQSRPVRDQAGTGGSTGGVP